MKILNLLAWSMLALGLIGLSAAFVAGGALAAKGRLVQRVAPYQPDVAQLVGETGEAVGEPQAMIIDDPAAFLPGKTSTGALLADDAYLKRRGIYPLQVKTVHFVAGVAKLGAAGLGAAGLAGLLGIGALRRRAACRA